MKGISIRAFRLDGYSGIYSWMTESCSTWSIGFSCNIQRQVGVIFELHSWRVWTVEELLWPREIRKTDMYSDM